MSHRRHSNAGLGCAVVLVPILAIGGGIVGTVMWQGSKDSVTCTVDEKDRVAKPKGGSDQRVYCEDGNVFQVGDDWLNGQWNSSDTYAQIDVGETYTFETVGWRNGFLSQFPNIISVTVTLP